MKNLMPIALFILFLIPSLFAGSKPSIPKNPVKAVKEKVTTKINNSDLKKSIDSLKGKVEGVVGDVSNIRSDIRGIKTNIEGIVSKTNQNKTNLDEANKKVNESDGKFNKVQAQFEKIELSIKKLATGETTPKEMVESTNIGEGLKGIKALSEAILILKNDLGLLKKLVLSNYHLIFYVTRDTCTESTTDENMGLDCSYKLKADDQVKKYFKNIKLDISFVTNESGEVLISGLTLLFNHPDSVYNVKLDKIGMSPKFTISGQDRHIDLVFSSTVVEGEDSNVAVKRFTAILDEPIVLAGDKYTGLSSIRDSEINQDLSFELKM